MEKIKKSRTVFQVNKNLQQDTQQFTWGEIMIAFQKQKFEIRDTDELSIGYSDDGFSYEVSVIRIELETDEEFEKRKNAFNNYKTFEEKTAYAEYLKLKERFEK